MGASVTSARSVQNAGGRRQRFGMLRAAADRAASEAGPDPFAYDTKHALSSRSLLKSGAVAESQLGARLSSLAKVGPMALIQFIDFATDVMVIIELFRGGDPLSARVGTACVCTSIGVAVLALLVCRSARAELPVGRGAHGL